MAKSKNLMERLRKYLKSFDDTTEDHVDLLSNSRGKMKKLGLLVDVVNIRAYFGMVPIVIFYNLIQIGQIGHLVHFLSNNAFSFFDVADDIAIILSYQSMNYVNYAMLVASPYLSLVCRQLGNFADPDLGRARGVVAIDRLFTKYVNGCLGFFFASAVCTWMIYIRDECEPDEVSACGFIFIPYLPVIDIYNDPWRKIVLTCQTFSAYTCAAVAMINISQYMFINEVLILRYSHLESLVDRIPTLKPEERKALIGRIVRYHCFLIRINTDINKLSSKAYGMHLCITPINMSVIAYQLIGKEMMLLSFVHFMCYVAIVTITCVSGERLITYTSNLHQRLFYAMPLEDVKTMKDMQLILLQSQNPLKVLAGGVASVDHVMMVNVYQTVWSTLMLLLQTN